MVNVNKSSVNLVELGWFLLSLTESNMFFINFPKKVWRTFCPFSEVFRTSGAVFSYIHAIGRILYELCIEDDMNVYIYNCKLRKNLLERIFSPVSEIFPDRKLWIEPVLAAVLAVAIVFCIEGLDLAWKSLSIDI